MRSRDNGDRPNLTNNTINRRNMLLAGTTLAAASALSSGIENKHNPRRLGNSQTSSSSWAMT